VCERLCAVKISVVDIEGSALKSFCQWHWIYPFIVVLYFNAIYAIQMRKAVPSLLLAKYHKLFQTKKGAV
jgi:hypothetical protein